MAIGVHGPLTTQRFGSGRHWWLHLYRYTAVIRIGDCETKVRPGYATLVPPGIETEYEFVERSSHLCAHFSFDADSLESVIVPAVQDLGSDFPRIYADLEDAASWFAANPQRAQVRLWDVLWQVIDRTVKVGAPPVHAQTTPVLRARQIIELRLGEPLSVKQIAEEVGISHNQLTRLFHESVGDTVIGYIRGRRALRGQHLLLHTGLPVKTIAAQVGVEEPSRFHKLIQDRFGKSPTALRREGETSRA